MNTNQIVCADAFEWLREAPAESVHAVVTDPPYGLNFMGRDWDNFRRRNNDADVDRDNVGGRLSEKAPASGAETDMHEYQNWCRKWAKKAINVLKPGGHMLAFSGNRTHHRLFSGVEDAGFEIRDTLTWHYGSGFPKALDVSKSIDKATGAEREVVGASRYADRKPNGSAGVNSVGLSESPGHKITAPATDAAKRWDGWKTSLKPATEFVVLARKPFSGTVAENVQAHGTGALNIDGCRIDTNGETPKGSGNPPKDGDYGEHSWGNDGAGFVTPDEGRYPANVIFDADAAEALDREVGETGAGAFPASASAATGHTYGNYDDVERKESIKTDTGGPSRYFYTSKATRAERTLDGRIDNAHPTVKPVDLMEWLVKLVTAEGQTVLDPFAGTGTTCRAAKNLGREFVGIEKQAKWADVARVRCGLGAEDPANIRADDAQTALSAFDASD